MMDKIMNREKNHCRSFNHTTTTLEHFQTFVQLSQISFLVFIRICRSQMIIPPTFSYSSASSLPYLTCSILFYFFFFFFFSIPILQHHNMWSSSIDALYHRSKQVMVWYYSSRFFKELS